MDSEPVVSAHREGPVVVLKAYGSGAAVGQWWKMSFDCNAEWAAILLTETIRNRMGDTVEAIRRDAYNAGWRDAKSHKASKRTFFSRFFGVRE